MMLRASVEMDGGEVDLNAVTKPGEDPGEALEGATELLAFADAMVGRDEAELDQARRALIDRLGAEQFVEAAAVVANFQRMVRIADATGIPLDGIVMTMTDDFRGELGIDAFEGAARSKPVGVVGKVTAPLLRGFFKRVMPRLAKRMAPGPVER